MSNMRTEGVRHAGIKHCAAHLLSFHPLHTFNTSFNQEVRNKLVYTSSRRSISRSYRTLFTLRLA